MAEQALIEKRVRELEAGAAVEGPATKGTAATVERLSNELQRVAVLARSRLEGLCRELQKQNTTLQEELQRSQEADLRKREQLSRKFQSTIDEIQQRISQDDEVKAQQAKDHQELREKVRIMLDADAAKTAHSEKLIQAKTLEAQLFAAKLKHAEGVAEFEGKKAESAAQECDLLRAAHAELKQQLQEYDARFATVGETLTQSSAAFAKFKTELAERDKMLTKATAEQQRWHSRYQKVNGALIKTKAEHAKDLEKLREQTAKTEALQKLCRALRTDATGGDAVVRPAADSGEAGPDVETNSTDGNAG